MVSSEKGAALQRAKLHLVITKAIEHMVVDHPSGLHECVADGRPDKLEPTPDQVFT